MALIKNKVGVVDSYFPNNKDGAIILWVNDEGKTEKVTLFGGSNRFHIDNVPVSAPIRELVAIGERVSFDAVPNNVQNSWGVTWRATAARKLNNGKREEPKSGLIVHVEANMAVISFSSANVEELCLFSLSHGDAMVNGVQVAKSLVDFLTRLAEVDFVPKKFAGLVVAKKFNCKWITHALFAENIVVPETHEAPRCVEQWARGSVVSVTDRRVIVQFIRPDVGERGLALLITSHFTPPTTNLSNVLKSRDEVEICYVPHKNPQNPDGCAFFALKARLLTKAERAATAQPAASASASAPAPAPAPVAKPAVRPSATAKDVSSLFESLSISAASGPTVAASSSVAVHPPPGVSDVLVLRLMKATKLRALWAEADILKLWLGEHPEYTRAVEQLIVEKYEAGEDEEEEEEEDDDDDDEDDEDEEEEEDDQEEELEFGDGSSDDSYQ